MHDSYNTVLQHFPLVSIFALAPHRRIALGIEFLPVFSIGITEQALRRRGCATLPLTQPRFSLDLFGYKYQNIPSTTTYLLARPVLEVKIGSKH